MAHIETLVKDGEKSFIGVIEFDDCSEVMDNFDGFIDGNRYMIENTNDVIKKLYSYNLIDRGEKEAIENCDYFAFTGVKSN